MATGVCPHRCIGGAKCGCNGFVAHHLHICRDPHCKCHQAAAYGDERTQGKHDYVYVPRGVMLVEAKQ